MFFVLIQKVETAEPAEERSESGIGLYTDPLVGREFVDNPVIVEAADTAHFFSTEHDVGLIVDRLVVNVNHAGRDPPSDSHAVEQVFGEHTPRKTVFGIIGDGKSFFFILCLDEADDGPEHFIAAGRHIVCAVSEHPRINVVAFGMSLKSDGCTGFYGFFDEPLNAVDLRPGDHRT